MGVTLRYTCEEHYQGIGMFSQLPALLRILRVPEWLIAPKDGDERNMSRGMYDGMGVGVVEGVQIFIPVLFTRLGADPLAVGLLTSLLLPVCCWRCRLE
jgi:hypothetical protein